jgi:hypothetical protein
LTNKGPYSDTGTEAGRLTGQAFPDNKVTKEGKFDLPLRTIQGVPFGGYVDTGRYGLVAQMFSPIEMDEFGFDVVHGFVGRGRVLPQMDLLKGRADLAIIMDARGVGMQAMLTADSFNLPGPFHINGGFLALAAQYPGGITASGRINFVVDKLATGYFEASIGTSEQFGVKGRLNFDSSMFQPAYLEMAYSDGRWRMEGSLTVPEGKVNGIKRATATVKIDGDVISAEGDFESSLKGLQGGKLGLVYDPAVGTTITGALTLGRLPGIEGGEVKAKVAQRTDGQGWSLAGEVTARPAIPGVTGTIIGRYEDGAFSAIADLGYKRGMLDGKVRLGVTNQKVGPDRQPTGPPIPDYFLVYGAGRVTLQLTPWLIGAAEIDIRPNGTIAVAGRIGLPDQFTLFDRRELNREIFSLGIDIPIIGIAFAGQRIGIFATIRGGLNLVAGIGPGQLLGTGVEVRYDPDREDATTVEGETRLLIPADAGLRLFVQGGVGAGIPLVSATAGIELGGQLGLAGALTAGVHLLWTRSRGLVMDAEAGLSVQPRFRFTADIFALVTAGIGPFTKELYSQKWAVAAFEYGADLRFGVVLPVHAENGSFDFSFDRMRFEYPSIDPGQIARDVLKQVLDR